MKTYKSVIRSLLADGYQIAVMDGEEGENLLKPSNKYSDIVEHVESMDCTSIEVFDPSAPTMGGSYTHRYGIPMIGWINIILDNDNEDDFEDCQDYSGKVIESTFKKLGGIESEVH